MDPNTRTVDRGRETRNPCVALFYSDGKEQRDVCKSKSTSTSRCPSVGVLSIPGPCSVTRRGCFFFFTRSTSTPSLFRRYHDIDNNKKST